MIEIYPDLFIGCQDDFEYHVRGKPGWAVVHACKEPYHRRALGYMSRGAPKDHPEYLIAIRGNELILNLVDAQNPAFFSKEIIDTAINFIDDHLKAGDKVLVHCNQGESRGPGIGLLYLAVYTTKLPNDCLEAAENSFRRIYPHYNPSAGMRGFLDIHWNEYIN